MGAKKIGFDGWVLDPDSGDLERAGARIRLQEQPLQVLMQLIDSRGGVVTREQLISKLWPKGVVDFDTGLNTAIRKLRVALGDTADTPRYIETLPRRGYRFIAALEPDPAREPEPEAQPQPESAAGVPTSDVPPVRTLEDSLPQTAVPPRTGYRASGGLDRSVTTTADVAGAPPPVSTGRPGRSAVVGAIVLAGAALLTGVYALWRERSGAGGTSGVEAPSQSGLPTNVAPTSAVAFAPPPHSIAVLPFVNLSGDKEQDYFSDGLTEELLNSLSRINELQVTGRTSSFYFKGEHADLATIAHKLNVATVLEGSVRRSAHTVRVSAQLINAETGFHLWSETYDRDLGDVLKLETEIANAVASALRITLLGDTAAKIELGGTRNPAAFDAYLRGTKAQNNYHSLEDLQAVIAAYTEAIRLDPNYALAFAGRSLALSFSTISAGSSRERNLAAAHADAQKAIALAPPMTEGHVALATFFAGTLDFTQAMAEHERALMLGPGNARALQVSSPFLVLMGRTDAGIAAARRAVVIDPLNPLTHFSLGLALFYARRYEEAVAAFGQVMSLDPDGPTGYAWRGFAYLLLGNAERARESCAVRPEDWLNQSCLALANDRLGGHADAETALARLKALRGGAAAYEYAEIYAQWGKTGEALNWLETALRLRDPALVSLKTEPRIDPLRKEPRFQAVERALKFPN